MSIRDAAAAIARALTAALGRAPTDRELAMLVAQAMFETRSFQALWWWNFGNLKARAGRPSYELAGASWQRFDSPDAGAAAFVGLIKARYPEAWALLDSADPQAYALQLQRRGYFGDGSLENYARGMSQIFGSLHAVV